MFKPFQLATQIIDKSNLLFLKNSSTTPKQADTHLNRSFGLDFLRAAAISLVLISHYGHQNFDAFGFWGVELFFALSGFLIGQILWKGYTSAMQWDRKQIFNFWSRRWWRTLPNYFLFFVIMILTTVYNHVSLPPLHDLVKFLWFGQFLLSHNWGFYSISWSLCIEEWFYLLFPIILLAFSRMTSNKKVAFTATLLFVLVGSVIVRIILMSNDPTSYLRGITLARLDAIGYGVLVAFVTSIINLNIRVKWLGFSLGVLLQLFTILTLRQTSLEYIVHSHVFLLLVPLGFALMLPIAAKWTEPEGLLHVLAQPVQKLSLWSYSIYLSHGPIMLFVYFILGSYRDTFTGNLFSKFLAFSLCMVVSALLFNYFEFPLTKKRPASIRN